MSEVLQGNLNAKGKRFGIVVSRFNDFITKELLSGCLDCLIRHGAREDDITVVWVPGSFEIPVALSVLAKKKKNSALICLGAVIKGDTPHNEYIAQEATKGIAKVSMEEGIPVAFGIITPDTLEQAIERAGTKAGNKGFQAALSAIEMANLMEVI